MVYKCDKMFISGIIYRLDLGRTPVQKFALNYKIFTTTGFFRVAYSLIDKNDLWQTPT